MPAGRSGGPRALALLSTTRELLTAYYPCLPRLSAAASWLDAGLTVWPAYYALFAASVGRSDSPGHIIMARTKQMSYAPSAPPSRPILPHTGDTRGDLEALKSQTR